MIDDLFLLEVWGMFGEKPKGNQDLINRGFVLYCISTFYL